MIRKLACLTAFAAGIWAQAPAMEGRFILAEEGATSTTLALLAVDSTGNVSGTQYVQASGVTQAVTVSGSVTLAADGSGSLALQSQVATEDGYAPSVSTVYDFLNAKVTGFSAIRRDAATTAVALILPASTTGAAEGVSNWAAAWSNPSGQRVAEIGVLSFHADGSLSGRVVTKRGSLTEAQPITGSFAPDGSGFGTLRLSSTSTDDEGASVQSVTSYIYAVAANGDCLAVRADNSLLGLARLTRAQ